MGSEQKSDLKQVIVIRRDLKMRRGKEIAQGSHASLAFIRERIVTKDFFLSSDEERWLNGGQKKVTCQVDTEEELLEVERRAEELGLEVHVITDSGHTEFHGVPTKTCLAIGPDDSSLIDQVTGNLKLY